MVFKLLQEDEVVLHAFACLANEGGKFRSNGSKVIAGVKVVDNEGGARLDVLKLFLPETEPVGPTEFMRHSAGDDVWVYVSGQD
jgi:hypothetical protein